MSKFALNTNTGNKYKYSAFFISKLLKRNGNNQTIEVAVTNSLKFIADVES